MNTQINGLIEKIQLLSSNIEKRTKFEKEKFSTRPNGGSISIQEISEISDSLYENNKILIDKIIENDKIFDEVLIKDLDKLLDVWDKKIKSIEDDEEGLIIIIFQNIEKEQMAFFKRFSESFKLIKDDQLLEDSNKETIESSNDGFIKIELQRLKNLQQRYRDNIEQLNKEVGRFQKNNSEQFSRLEIIRQQANFRSIAISAKRASNFWRFCILLSILSLFFISWLFSSHFGDDFIKAFDTKDKFIISQETTLFYVELIKRILLKILAFTVALILLRFSIRNYNFTMHSYTINMHKSCCFGAVYDISISIKADDKTKESLINLAGKEIFEQYKTGYLNKEETKFDLKFLEKISAVFTNKNETDK